MGADLCLAHVAFLRKQPIDWDAGRRRIGSLTIEELAEHGYVDYYDSPEGVEASEEGLRVQLFEDLEAMKTAIEGSYRTVDWIDVGPYRVYVTGGMSWGDSPTEEFDVFARLGEAGILEPLGSVGVWDELLRDDEQETLSQKVVEYGGVFLAVVFVFVTGLALVVASILLTKLVL